MAHLSFSRCASVSQDARSSGEMVFQRFAKILVTCRQAGAGGLIANGALMEREGQLHASHIDMLGFSATTVPRFRSKNTR